MQIFGDFINNLPKSEEYLIIGFSPSSTPLKQRWRNNGLSADFLADYLTTFFPTDSETNDSFYKQAEVRNAVSYIANELLENAMKYNNETSSAPISIQLHLKKDLIIFAITNSICPQSVTKFQAYIEKLLAEDPEELYIRQLEKSVDDESSNSSGLGLLTMLNDYMTKLGWKFEANQQNPEDISVTTMVQLVI